MENLAASTVTPEEHTLLEHLDRLLPLQREKLYELFRGKRIADRNNPEYLRKIWETDPRWKEIVREYAAEDVIALRGDTHVEHTLAQQGADRFWHLLHTEPYIRTLGAMTGNQAVQQVAAGLKAIYLSGWQVAADANLARSMYPDQSLYPVNSVPEVAHAINNALLRAEQVHTLQGKKGEIHWRAPIVADAEAGFGGPLNAFELMKAMVEAGVAGVHFEDQLASAKKCGHLGGKVLVPTGEFITKLQAARLAADTMDVPTILIARTDADSASFLTNDIDERDYRFLQSAPRTREGFYPIKGGLDMAIARGLSYAPYADMLWCETSHPDLDEARAFADAIHEEFPGKLLAYNCSPSFNWKQRLDDATIARFHEELGKRYKFLFVTLAGFHSLNESMSKLSGEYHREGMPAYVRLQEREFELERIGYGAVKHQKFVGTGYFDKIMQAVTQGQSALGALKGSTEEAQFTTKNT